MSGYDKDFCVWAQQQADLLRERRFEELDIGNIIEELEAISRAEVREIRESVTEIIVANLLLRAAPVAKERWEWQSTISNHRTKIDVAIETSPSLKSMLKPILEKKREVAVRRAADRLATLDYAGADSLDGAAITLEDVFGRQSPPLSADRQANLAEREAQWNEYKAALKVIAQQFGTTVHCTPKNGYLRVNFNVTGLTQEQALALSTIESMVELVTEFQPGFLEGL